MARIVLKDPKHPSLKKQYRSRADIYKRYLILSIILNISLGGGLVYTKNKLAADVLFTKLLNNIKRLM